MKEKFFVILILAIILTGIGAITFRMFHAIENSSFLVFTVIFGFFLLIGALVWENSIKSKRIRFRKLIVSVLIIIICSSAIFGFLKGFNERQKEYRKHLKQEVKEFEPYNRSDNEIIKEQIIPLHEAVKSGIIKEVEKLISQGENVDVRDGWAYTPLHIAARKGNLEIVEYLVARGADVNARNDPRSRDMPLTLAVEKGHWQTAKFLIANGADVNDYCLCSGTPLHIAADKGYAGLCEILLDNGAEINSTRGHIDKYTPLHEATFEGNMEAVKLLLSRGADINARGCHNENPSVKLTPLDVAEDEFDIMTKEKIAKKRLVTEYLLQHGAKTSAELDKV